MFNKFSVVTVCALGLVFAGALSPPVWATEKSEAEIERAVREVIRARHPEESQEWWRALGPDAPEIIIRIYKEVSGAYPKGRLLGGLAAFSDSPEAVEFLRGQADKVSNDVLRQQAIRSLGASQGAKELEFISKFLKHADEQTRFAAAEALSAIPEGRPALDLYLKEEKAEWIGERLRGVLPRPGAATLAPVSSSEDRANPDFAGEWKGYWIAPSTGAPAPGPGTAPGFTLEQAALALSLEGARELRGELKLARKAGGGKAGSAAGNAGANASGKRVDTFVLRKLEGKASKITGSLPPSFLPPAPVPPGTPRISAPEVPFEGMLVSEGGTLLIRITVPRVGGTVVLRKSK